LVPGINISPLSLNPLLNYKSARFTSTAYIQNINLVYSASLLPNSLRSQNNLFSVVNFVYSGSNGNETLFSTSLIRAIPGEVLPSSILDRPAPNFFPTGEEGVQLNKQNQTIGHLEK
jgi:hypothetical protein